MNNKIREIDLLHPLPENWMARLSWAASKEAKKGEWKTWNTDLPTLRANLTKHVIGSKDGKCFLQGSAAGGHRIARAMETLHIIGIDVDNGMPSAEIDRIIRDRGIYCIRYTTHSHGKSYTEIRQDDWVKYTRASPGATIGDYLQAKKRYLPEVAGTARIAGEEVTSNGLVLRVEHAPMDKNRLVFILAKPWRLTDYTSAGKTQDEAIREWKAAYLNFSAWLGIPADESCTDPSRLFYFPRYEADAPYEAVVHEGKAVNIFAVPQVGNSGTGNAFLDAASSLGATGEQSDLMRWLKKWAVQGNKDRFLIYDALQDHAEHVLRPEKDAEGKHHIECAFEDEHSTLGGYGTFVMNAGDSNKGQFVIRCQHHACQSRQDALVHLAAMIDKGWLPVDVLTDERYQIETVDDESAENNPPESKGWADLDELNKEFALVVMKDKIRILREVREQPEPNFLTVEGFHQLLANRKMEITSKKEVRGKAETVTEEIPASKAWMAWKRRRQYDGVAFEPSGVKGNLYNRWTGFPVQPKPGDWTLLRGHIHDNVCRGDEIHFRWLMTWLAQIVQQPGEKMGSAIVIRGKKGAGKSKLLDWFRAGLGKYAIKVSDPKHLVGNFNAHHETALLLVAEEGFFAGDPRAEARLKDLITSGTTVIERKGVDPYEVSNFTRLAITSNEDWVVPATIGERRYLVLECGNGRIKDTHFFGAVDAEMKAGGLEAMFHELANWSLEGVDLRNPPATDGLRAQIFESLPPEKRFFVEMVLNGGVVDENGYSSFEWPDETAPFILVGAERNRIIAAYEAYLARFPGATKYQMGAQQFGKHAKEVFPGFISDRSPVRKGKVVQQVPSCTFPPLIDLRAHCAEHYGIRPDL